MQVFVYEFITGGGLWSLDDATPVGSLLAEGQAMAAAIAADFRLAGHEVRSLCDARLPTVPDAIPIASARDEQAHFAELASASDWTLVIAPESDGALLGRCQWVGQCGGRLLSPSAESIALTSDKCRTADHLRKHGIPASDGIRVEPDGATALPADLFPAVLKPIDGCGSQGMRLLADATDFAAAAISQPMRLERFVPGRAASVAVLCGLAGCAALPACQQRLSRDGRFTYLGGRLPLSTDLDRRARRLAAAAVKSLPDPLGYIGVDLVLGDAADGSEDRVIEINPRLTTSYVGLRALCADNLAAAMMAVAEGREASLSWRSGLVEFAADGTIGMIRSEPQEELVR